MKNFDNLDHWKSDFAGRYDEENAPELYCRNCGIPIYPGHEYFRINGKAYCLECVEVCTAGED